MTRVSTGALVLIAVGAGLSVGAWGFWADTHGRANVRLCGAMEPGGHRMDLMHALGSPTAHALNPAGTRLVLMFRSPLFAPRPIRAVINVRDDVVMELDCGDGRIHIFDKY